MATVPTSVTEYQTGFAPEIAPYAQNLLGAAQGSIFQYEKDKAGKNVLDKQGMPIIKGFQPYQSYNTQDRFAQFTPLQQQAFSGAENMLPSQTTAGGAQLAGLAGLGALGTQYNFDKSNFNKAAYDQLANPFLEVQNQATRRQADIARQQQGAQAARSGAFGGSGDYLMRNQGNAELQRNLAKNQFDAFNQAQQQYNTQNQLNAQQQQFGAGLGLQGLQTALSGANTLGQLGQQQFQQGMDINKLQGTYGGEQQKQMQQFLSADYENFLNRQNHPYKQMGFMSDMIRGLPLSQTGSSVYKQPDNMLAQVGGLAAGFGNLFGGKKEGGTVSSYAEGGLSITNPDDSKLERMMDGMSDEQLQQIVRGSADPDARRIAEEELASRSSSISHAMARGGIVAFAEGGDKGEKKEESSGVSGLAYLAAAFPGLFQAGKAIAAPIADATGSILKGVGNVAKGAGPAYMSPAGSATLGGGMALSEGATKYLNKLSDEDLETLSQAGGGDDTGIAAAILREGRKTEQKKQQYADEVGGGRGKAPASAYDVKALAEHLGKSTRGSTAKDNKGGGASNASQKIVQGATRIAEQQGVPKEDFEAIMDRMMAKFKGANDKDLEGLAKMVAEEKENAKSIMGDATRQALSKFGFQLAANAANAGKGLSGLLRAASSASPVLAESMAESRKAAQAAQENARRMQIEFTKYKVALSKGDQQTAISLASNIRMMMQQQAQLDETIRSNKTKEGLMAQRNAATAGRGQEKTFAPILRGIGQANQMASKNAMELLKARPDLIQKGEKPEDALERVRTALAAKYRKEAVPMFAPTGKVYGGSNDDDMEE